MSSNLDVSTAVAFPLSHDKSQARAFVEALTGSPDTVMSWAVLVDDGGKPGPNAPQAPWRFDGSLEECWNRLEAFNHAGFGIYAVVNEGGHTDAEITSLRSLIADDDDGALHPESLAVPPSIVVESKRGVHTYWLMQPGQDLSLLVPATKAIAAKLGTDPKVATLSRVLRVPGFYHLKNRADPFLVRLLSVNDRRYTVAEVVAGLAAEAQVPAPRTRADSGDLPTELDDDTRTQLEALGIDQDRAFDLARAYLENTPGAVEGERGNDRTFFVACWLIGHTFTREDAWNLLCEWNGTCDPPWKTDRGYGPDSLPRLFESALARKAQGAAGRSPFAFEKLVEQEQYEAGREADRAASLAFDPKTQDHFNQARLRLEASLTPANKPLHPESKTKGTNPLLALMRGFTAEELFADPPPIKWILHRYIPAEPGRIGIFVGRGGLGKTTLVLSFLLHRALGLPFLGVKTTPGKSVFVTLEEGWVQLHRRVHALVLALQRDGVDIDAKAVEENLLFLPVSKAEWPLIDTGPNASHGTPSQKAIKDLAEAIREKAPGCNFVVLETVARMTGDESNEGYSVLVEAVESVLANVGASGLVIHHPTKAGAKKNEGGILSGRGGSTLENAARYALVMVGDDDHASKTDAILRERRPVDRIELAKAFGESMPPLFAQGEKVYKEGNPEAVGLAFRLADKAEVNQASGDATKVDALVEAVRAIEADGGKANLSSLRKSDCRPDQVTMGEVPSLIEKAIDAGKIVLVGVTPGGGKRPAAPYYGLPPAPQCSPGSDLVPGQT